MSGTSLTIKPAQFAEVTADLERWKNKYNKIQAVGEEKAGLLIDGVTVVGTEAALGYARGRYGKIELAGIPAEAYAGAACELLALMGVFGKHSSVIAAMGHATLGFMAGIELYEYAQKERATAQAPAKQVVTTQGEPTPEAKPAARQPRGALADRRRTIDTSSVAMAEDAVTVPRTGTE